MLTALRERWDDLLDYAERRLPALTWRRKPEALPIRLHMRRIYVLPTGFGLFFGFGLTVMLLGALNFSNNAALLLTFTLAGALILSLPRTVRHLNRVELSAARAAPVHAGDTLELNLHLAPLDAQQRVRLKLRNPHGETLVDLGGEGGVAVLSVPTERRGLMPIGRVILSTEFPLGVFRAWSYLHPQQSVLVYPRPEPEAPPLPRASIREGARLQRVHGDDWYGLREYRAGDPPRLTAWKASARQDRLLVKEFAQSTGDEVTLDWHELAALAPEPRISRLTRWVLDAAAEGLAYRLVLPAASFGPARGSDHLARCLRELALLP